MDMLENNFCIKLCIGLLTIISLWYSKSLIWSIGYLKIQLQLLLSHRHKMVATRVHSTICKNYIHLDFDINTYNISPQLGRGLIGKRISVSVSFLPVTCSHSRQVVCSRDTPQKSSNNVLWLEARWSSRDKILISSLLPVQPLNHYISLQVTGRNWF